VAVQRAQEAERRSQARALKEALLTQWESWLAAVDWERAEHGAIQTQSGQMLAQWRSAPLAGFRDERLLRKRADTLRADVEQHLAAARRAELERRQQLIEAALALGSDPDLRQATDRIKSLQEKWRAPEGALRLARGEEQKLWRQFRAACDAVFARRDALRSEEASRREQQAQARTQLLENFAASLDESNISQIKAAMAHFASQWHAARPGLASARAGPPADGQDRQARALQQRAQQRIEELRRESYRGRLDQWRQTAPSTEGLDDDALEQGRQARESVLLDLELALDLPSPGGSTEARRRRQLEQLQNRFRTGVQQRPDAEKLLAQWHAIAAAADTGQERRLAAVVEKLLARNARDG
jgi:hypothetical protein